MTKSMRNIYNTDAVDQFIAGIAASASDPNLQNWIITTVRRWVLKNYPAVTPLVLDRVTGRLVLKPRNAYEEPRPITNSGDSVPAWCVAALTRGQTVFFVHLDAALRKRIRRVVDFLWTTRHPTKGIKLDRLSFPDAEDSAREWRRERWCERVSARGNTGLRSVYKGDGGIEIVKLTKADHLVEEGRRMNNCVGDYDDEVREGTSEIFSLRDASGASKATIEIYDGNKVWQVKGPANSTVSTDYRQHLRHFVYVRGYRIKGDADSLSILDPDNPLMKDPGGFLRSTTGRRLLAAANTACPDQFALADLQALGQMLHANADRISPSTRGLVFASLCPHPEQLVRLEPINTISVYDVLVRIYAVSAPVLLASLDWRRVFKGLPVEHLRAEFRDRLEQQLAALAFAPPDCLFLLGRRRPHGYRTLPRWITASEFLPHSRIDVRRAAVEKKNRMLERLNESKRRVLGRAAKVSEAHQTIREFFRFGDEMTVV